MEGIFHHDDHMRITRDSLSHKVLITANDLAHAGNAQFHGYEVALRIAGTVGRAALIGHGSLYKALLRLEAAGYLESRWKDQEDALTERRPRRRMYSITGAGARALSDLAVPASATPHLAGAQGWN